MVTEGWVEAAPAWPLGFVGGDCGALRGGASSSRRWALLTGFDKAENRNTLSYMNTLTVRIPDELKSDLQKISETEHKPVSDLVRESLRRFVAVERFRQLRRKALPFAEAQGFLTDDDIFTKLK